MRFAASLLLVLVIPAAAAWSKQSGVDSPFYFPPIGCGVSPDGGPDGCHDTSANPSLLIAIQGPTQIPSGNAGNYMASVPQGFLGHVGSGINVAVGTDSTANCTLDTLGAQNLQLIGGDIGRQPTLSHTDATNPAPTGNLGVWSYMFQLANCTKPGNLHLLLAMNTFNGDGQPTGDAWNKKDLNVKVPEPDASTLGTGALSALALVGSRVAARRGRGVGVSSAAPPIAR